MRKKVKIAVGFTLPPSLGFVKADDFKDKERQFFSYLEFSNAKFSVLLSFKRTNKIEWKKLILQETYLLSRVFSKETVETDNSDIEENGLLFSQLEKIFTQDPREKVKWNAFFKFLINTYSSLEIIKKEFKRWFIISPHSVFAKLFELSENPKEFVNFYIDFLNEADVIVPFSSLINIYRYPIELSFYLSQIASPTSYNNYWLFYFPLSNPTHIKGVLYDEYKNRMSANELTRIIKNHNKAKEISLKVYCIKEFCKKTYINSLLNSYFRKNGRFTFLFEGSLHLIFFS